MSTKSVVQSAVQRVQGKGEPESRAYAFLDHIAVQRQASEVRRLTEECIRAERSMAALPLNPGGFGDPSRQYVLSQQAQALAERRETLKAVSELDGDPRVLRFCSDLLADTAAPLAGQILINGEPVARGGYAPAYAPGMGTANVM
jgi:hypothetical protein